MVARTPTPPSAPGGSHSHSPGSQAAGTAPGSPACRASRARCRRSAACRAQAERPRRAMSRARRATSLTGARGGADGPRSTRWSNCSASGCRARARGRCVRRRRVGRSGRRRGSGRRTSRASRSAGRSAGDRPAGACGACRRSTRRSPDRARRCCRVGRVAVEGREERR